jgi:hypothetical protein
VATLGSLLAVLLRLAPLLRPSLSVRRAPAEAIYYLGNIRHLDGRPSTDLLPAPSEDSLYAVWVVARRQPAQWVVFTCGVDVAFERVRLTLLFSKRSERKREFEFSTSNPCSANANYTKAYQVSITAQWVWRNQIPALKHSTTNSIGQRRKQ